MFLTIKWRLKIKQGLINVFLCFVTNWTHSSVVAAFMNEQFVIMMRSACVECFKHFCFLNCVMSSWGRGENRSSTHLMFVRSSQTKKQEWEEVTASFREAERRAALKEQTEHYIHLLIFFCLVNSGLWGGGACLGLRVHLSQVSSLCQG